MREREGDRGLTVRVLDIVRGTTVDGPGFRTSIYMSGCRHACPGCHNPESWNFGAGQEKTLDDIMHVIEEEKWDVTLSGGDPLYHPEQVGALGRMIHDLGHTLWVYTGFVWEELINIEGIQAILGEIDVIVDGPFQQELRDTDLLFRGSGNQRIIDVAKSLEAGKIINWSR